MTVYVCYRIIATPGRLMHVLVEMNFRLQSVEYVVFDEADRCVLPEADVLVLDQMSLTLACLISCCVVFCAAGCW